MKGSEVLDRTKTAIIEHGHAKRALKDGHGRMCLVGALGYAEHGDANTDLPPHLDAFAALWDVVGRDNHIDVWNNAPERTVNEVMDLLDEARLLCKQREADGL